MNFRFRVSAAHLLVGITLFSVGFLAVMQLRTQIRTASTVKTRSTSEQAMIISKLVESNVTLRQTVSQLEEQIARYQTSSEEEKLEAMVADLNNLKVLGGVAEVVGEGVEVKITGKIAPSSLQDIINELRNSGAESIALNDRRLIARSIVTGDETGFLVDGVRLRPPYVLRVIGSSQTMYRALERKGGLLELLRYNDPTLIIQVTTKERLTLPVYDRDIIFTYGKPATQQSGPQSSQR
ncbi:MAG: DUF881 domain-containing protein [Chloroflexi bacterium]|nr:DUF881 domain-containing protein [Chloroflexota bacterium]